ncbi:MAG: cupin domain-containing protein [Campylobacter sp.]|nr:cupin domain-containing protein [Campylobacter sp.]
MTNLTYGEVFKLSDLGEIQKDGISNLMFANTSGAKFLIKNFDENAVLGEHKAPGDAVVFALSGEAIISYEGNDFHIKQGQNFVFQKGGRHAIKAIGKFKMALLIVLE